jgi:hypothetical protein
MICDFVHIDPEERPRAADCYRLLWSYVKSTRWPCLSLPSYAEWKAIVQRSGASEPELEFELARIYGSQLRSVEQAKLLVHMVGRESHESPTHLPMSHLDRPILSFWEEVIKYLDAQGMDSEANRVRERLASSVCANRRYVYIVSKPVHVPGFAFLSDSKFPLCHWGVVLSQYDEDRLKEFFSQQSTNPLYKLPLLGTLFELKRPNGPTTWQLNIDDKFGVAIGSAIGSEWSRMSISYLGETNSSDDQIKSCGMQTLRPKYLQIFSAQQLTEASPMYHGLTNNCQNFVVYLLRYICPQSTLSVLPTTIQKTLYGVWELAGLDGRGFQVVFPREK